MALPLIRHIDQQVPSNTSLAIIVKSDLEESVIRLLEWRCRITIKQIGGVGFKRWVKAAQVGLGLRLRGVSKFLMVQGNPSPGTISLANLVAARETIVVEGVTGVRGAVRTVMHQSRVHKSTFYLSFAESAGLPSCFDWHLTLPNIQTFRERGRVLLGGGDLDQRWIFFAPGSGELEKHKRWPISYYSELAASLLREDSRIRIGYLGAPREYALLRQGLPLDIGLRKRCQVFPGDSIADGVARLANAQCLITGCSGTAHLATLVNIPIVAIYGPTNAAFTGPRNDRVYIVSRELACSPCYRHGFISGCGRPICMTGIAVEDVRRATVAALSGVSPMPMRWRETTEAVSPIEERSGDALTIGNLGQR